MRLACVQMDVRLGQSDFNADTICDHLTRLAESGVQLAIFPEAALTGYCVDSLDAARAIAIPANSAAIHRIQRVVDATGILAVFGFAESTDGRIHNAAALLEPGTPVRLYRKSHLPVLGLDRFVEGGSELVPFDTRLGRIGVLICYDMRPPEAARVLALANADIIVLPTNWPEGAEISADHVGIARAAENRVFVATCNRVGTENGFRFIGRSKIIHASGRVLASAGDEEQVIVADVDFADARQKRVVNVPGAYELEILGCRRPELYGALADPL